MGKSAVSVVIPVINAAVVPAPKITHRLIVPVTTPQAVIMPVLLPLPVLLPAPSLQTQIPHPVVPEGFVVLSAGTGYVMGITEKMLLIATVIADQAEVGAVEVVILATV